MMLRLDVPQDVIDAITAGDPHATAQLAVERPELVAYLLVHGDPDETTRRCLQQLHEAQQQVLARGGGWLTVHADTGTHRAYL
jgi:hypothetical protein